MKLIIDFYLFTLFSCPVFVTALETVFLFCSCNHLLSSGFILSNKL
uniref:Uncharacterized protein n=1 Tax=Anguilla anguilla TaxID=7936 RepID=A0A0E9S9Q7_ANGAN